MKRAAVVTVGRSDYGIYRPILKLMSESPELEPILLVGGAHLSERHGCTIREVELDAYPIGARIEMLSESDSSEAVSKAIGIGVIGFSEAYARLRPDLILVLGDRFEMASAALAALPFKIPLAHIHGGEVTEGAIDDSLRHSITKLSHLHLVSAKPYADRVRQLGEEPWRIQLVGAPGLDSIRDFRPLTGKEFVDRFGFELPPRFLLATYHPTTLREQSPGEEFQLVLEALIASDLPVIFTAPNADPGGLEIRSLIGREIERRRDWKLVESFGTHAYFTVIQACSSMVGNSSSGIIEAPSFQTPVVNIGDRQKGRVRGVNVIDVPLKSEQVLKGIERAISPEFKAGLAGSSNPYGDGNAASRIVKVLEETELSPRLIEKKFFDMECREA